MAKRKRLAKAPASVRKQNTGIRDYEDANHNEFISHSGSGIAKRIQLTGDDTSRLIRPDIKARVEEKELELPDEPILASDDKPLNKPTQTAAYLAEFMNNMDGLEAELLDLYAHSSIGETCGCGQSTRVVHCYDCIQFQPTCRECWVEQHRTRPLHWAHVWDLDKGYFLRTDYSMIYGDGPDVNHGIQLGHNGGTCTKPSSGKYLFFTVVHSNGVHATKLRFCSCGGMKHHWRELMRARLFPATMCDPKSAFTFDMLRSFAILAVQSHISAWDYMLSIRRVTDNVFTSKVPDPYLAFLRVMRVWNLLTAKRRQGQLHGIDAHVPNRPAENLVVMCPSCPELGVNLEERWEDTPAHLRRAGDISSKHLHSLTLTADGNHKLNRHKKNTDPNDVSLFAGKATYATDREYKRHLQSTPHTNEKSTCNYLNAVNKQDQTKFKGMDETGAITIQCTHVFFQATADMYAGERYMYTDFALARALRLRPWLLQALQLGGIPLDISYDAFCMWVVHMMDRMEANHSDIAPLLKDAVGFIPALHIQNHKERCMYEFGGNYKIGSAKQNLETAEQPWSESNEFAGQTRQMNSGHRQDTIIVFQNDWMWRKVVKQVTLLSNDLITAWKQYVEKRAFVKELTVSHKRDGTRNVGDWARMDRGFKYDAKTKMFSSIYRHSSAKMPTLESIHQHLLAQHDEHVAPGVSVSDGSKFLLEGLRIQKLQGKLRRLLKDYEDHPVASSAKAIKSQRADLEERIRAWRRQQTVVMAQLDPLTVILDGGEVESEKLYLPSEIPSSEHVRLALVPLAGEEAKLREGEAFDFIRKVQSTVRSLSAMKTRIQRDTSGVAGTTRSLKILTSTRNSLDDLISGYNASRHALIELGSIKKNDPKSPFPAMRKDDTRRKDTEGTRKLGDSRRGEGKLWTMRGKAGGNEEVNISDYGSREEEETSAGDRDISLDAGTQMSTRKKVPARKKRKLEVAATSPSAFKSFIASGKGNESNGTDRSSKKKRGGGWVWSVGSMGKMSGEDMVKWELECKNFQDLEFDKLIADGVPTGDRVQWHRAEAEMMRWLEQLELKHAEFMRCIKCFATMSSIWTALGASNTQPGPVAYARRQAAMYSKLEANMSGTFQEKGLQQLMDKRYGVTLAQRVQAFRKEELAWLDDLIKTQGGSNDSEAGSDSEEFDDE